MNEWNARLPYRESRESRENLESPENRDENLEEHSFLKQLEIPLLIRVLKECASKESPMSARRISDELSVLTGLDHSEKTILRKLQRLTVLQKDLGGTELGDVLYLSLGGKVVEVSGKACISGKVAGESAGHQRTQSRYYFEALLDQSDVDMICGTITSNRYLTQKEKDYLISRQQELSGGAGFVAGGRSSAAGERYATSREMQSLGAGRPLPAKPASRRSADWCAPDGRPLPAKPTRKKDADSARVLTVVNRLHEAITKQLQVKIVYGAYGRNEKSPGTVELKPKNVKKPYILNPYALLWNDGEYYLLATHRGHTNPSHFRVDRIVLAEIACQPDDATRFVKREKIPDVLRPYFRKSRGVYEFLDEKYTTTYPMMVIYGEKDICSCIIECRSNVIGVVVDYFGTGIRILPPRLARDPQDLRESQVHSRESQDSRDPRDLHDSQASQDSQDSRGSHHSPGTGLTGNPPTYVAIRLPEAQYDNVKAFCLLQQGLVRAVAPERLVRDVAEQLKEDARRYQV